MLRVCMRKVWRLLAPVERFFHRQPVVEFLVALQTWNLHIDSRRADGQPLEKLKKRHKSGPASEDFDGTQRSKTRDGSWWDWSGMPCLPRFFDHYRTFINCFFAFVLVKSLTRHHLPGLLPNCYALGNFFIHDAIQHHLVMLYCGFLLLWESIVYLRHRSHVFGLYVFLAISERDLEKFYAHLRAQRGQESTLIEQENIRHELFLLYHPPHPFIRRDEFDHKELKKRPAASLNQHRRHLRASPASRKDHALGKLMLIREALCFRIDWASKVIYRLRPNRTLEARHKLRQHQARLIIFVFANHLVPLSLAIAMILYRISDPKRYLRLYPGCDSSLSALTAEQRDALTFLVPTKWDHYTLSWIVDLVENIVLVTEVSFNLLFNWAFMYFLNYDILLYLRGLHGRLNHIHARILTKHHADGNLRRTDVSSENYLGSLNRLTHADQQVQYLDAQIYELLIEFNDFLMQVKHLDLVVSDAIPYIICVWVYEFVLFGDLIRSEPAIQGDVVVWSFFALVVAFTYVVISIACLSFFSVHANCLKSIKVICSIMALHDGSQKVRLANLLEFYTTTKRSAYTLLRQRPFTRSTYLSIFGWCISSYFLFVGFRRIESTT